ncbi:MAG: hypothetical protein PHY59_04275 [Methanobacterium sp.]|nr:hypothetical protein [Methanobacterium sp.]
MISVNLSSFNNFLGCLPVDNTIFSILIEPTSSACGATSSAIFEKYLN